MGGKGVTIRDIALAAGVSKSTVANALKGSAQCSPETGERIRRLAKELGYRSNPLVAAHFANVRRRDMAGGFKASLAYLADSPRSEIVRRSHKHYPAYAGARQRAEELGFGLDVFWYQEPGLSWVRLKRILQSRNIHGIVFAPHEKSRVRLDLDWDCFSVAMIGGSIVYPKFDRVEFDHLSNMEELFDRMSVSESDKVGLALPFSIDERVRHQFRLAYSLFQERRKKSLRIPGFIPEIWERSPFLEWYAKQKPEVIVTVYGDVRQWLQSMGRRVPEDVRLYTPGALADAEDHSGFRLSLDLLGRAAVDSVAGQLFRNERGVPKTRSITMIVGEWQDGRTG